MPKFLIERNVPSAGSLSLDQLRIIAQSSNAALKELGLPEYHWLLSIVTDDKIYAIHIAPDVETVREHARLGGLPANLVSEIKTIIDPTTGDK